MKQDNYEDIINLPHHVSTKYPQMTIGARAAQFAPFSALTGHKEAIQETERLTDKKIEIDEGLKNLLNKKLQIIQKNMKANPEITFTYFIYDDKKSGGKYISETGIVKKIDSFKQQVILINKKIIPIKEIINISGELFKNNED